MKIKGSSLTVFFIVLTFSIGLVSVNSPLTVMTQNGVLSQSGGRDEAEQDMEQSQSSEQNGQVISGDISILSGNNLMCQNQDNSEVKKALKGICNLGEMNLPANGPTAKVIVNATVNDGPCNRGKQLL